MTRQEFAHIRKKLDKTQKQLSELLGTSLKAVHSYEQGWRNIPPHVERQLFFLVAMRRGENQKDRKPCWIINRMKNRGKVLKMKKLYQVIFKQILYEKGGLSRISHKFDSFTRSAG